MSKHDLASVHVRASVWPRCDLACGYCPVDEGMENRTPAHLATRDQRLSTKAYLVNLASIAAEGVGGVSFTGGEPTLRPDLDRLLAGARPLFDRVELTTNGARLPRFAAAVRGHVDLLKVSLDAVDPDRVARITGRRHGYAQAVAAIEWAVAQGVPLGINTVLMRSTVDDLDATIRFARDLTRRASAPVYLSLLDFYYTPTRRDLWLEEFLPVNDVLDRLSGTFGAPVEQDRFGCRFWWFDADGLQVRVKDSWSATMRAPKCQACPVYCQEGVYGIKHSAEGWLTTCPTDRLDHGLHLSTGLNGWERKRRVGVVLDDVTAAVAVLDSFTRMIETHRLAPAAVVGQTTASASAFYAGD
jgi:molybdenum cofactor biosynthesis enzyme MoaA